MKKEKKKQVLIFSIMGVLLIGIAISFAYWQIVFEQDNPNVVTTDCFKVTFTDGDAIHIPDAYPVSDTEGMKNDSYDFTVTNVCNNRVLYQINLESLIPEGKRLPEKYIKADLMEESISKVTTKLEEELKVEPTIEGADNSYKLLEGEIGANSSKTFHLRLWMHSEVTSHDEESMNATYEGKISVITSYVKPLLTLVETIKNIPVVTSGDGLYEVSHEDAEITYTDDVNTQNLLKQTELRYAGSNPNNYVKFNNELWRVIGLVNTPEGQRVKIIRDESIGAYSWDSSEPNINEGWGINEWSQSAVKTLLNQGAYYNRTSGTCYNNQNNVNGVCDFSTSGLMSEAKEMIDTVTWNTGSSGETLFYAITTNQFYNLERSNNKGKTCSSGIYCNDNVSRTITWFGQIGLMYPSDYGYATSGGNESTREVCLSKVLYSWSNNSDCYENDWLYRAGSRQWTITQRPDIASTLFRVLDDGNVNSSHAGTADNLHPSLYLQLTIKVSNGNGTLEKPFEIIL